MFASLAAEFILRAQFTNKSICEIRVIFDVRFPSNSRANPSHHIGAQPVLHSR